LICIFLVYSILQQLRRHSSRQSKDSGLTCREKSRGRKRSVYTCSVVAATAAVAVAVAIAAAVAASIIAVEGAAIGGENRKIDKVIRLSRGFPVWALHQHFTYALILQ
uniref:Col_cuticle_N domain-containing protein n=1 Tax=Brugia timori TaxID=42155 RepID=A0A0R3Q6K8_9BILA